MFGESTCALNSSDFRTDVSTSLIRQNVLFYPNWLLCVRGRLLIDECDLWYWIEMVKYGWAGKQLSNYIGAP